MKTDKMVELNNERRKQLTDENEKYYGDVLVYLRASNVSQKQSEELALELLEHLIIAQKNGRTAEEVFGDNPEEYCEELVASLPKKTLKTSIKRISYMAVMFLTFYFFATALGGLLMPLFGVPSAPALSLSLVVDVLIAIVSVECLLFVVKKSTFGTLGKVKFSFITGGIVAGSFSVFLLTAFLFKSSEITLPSWAALGLAFIGFITYKFGMKNIEM